RFTHDCKVYIKEGTCSRAIILSTAQCKYLLLYLEIWYFFSRLINSDCVMPSLSSVSLVVLYLEYASTIIFFSILFKISVSDSPCISSSVQGDISYCVRI